MRDNWLEIIGLSNIFDNSWGDSYDPLDLLGDVQYPTHDNYQP